MYRKLSTWAVILSLCAATCARADATHPRVQIETTMGAITVELDLKAAPKTVHNFLAYVHSGFYTNTIIHRVIKSFMIQGGGFTPQMQQKITRSPIENEADNGLKNLAGTIAMARTSAPHSATAQFFINVKDNDFLNYRTKTPSGWGYCVFGHVVDGMAVVHAIENVKTTTKFGYADVPVTPVVIQRISLLDSKGGN
jgi:peptidyl-prolyl cis-trans isomerase B (cyclophilin B)